MAIVTMLLLLGGPQAEAALARAQRRLAVTAPEPRRPGAQWRIESDATVVDGKARALGTTGEQCQVVGARMCTRPPRTLLRAPLTR